MGCWKEDGLVIGRGCTSHTQGTVVGVLAIVYNVPICKNHYR